MKRIYAFICGICALSAFTSCENKEVEFDDFDYQTVYFAKQSPIRTIVLGDNVYPTELDNQHQFEIYATVGGVWKNRQDRAIQVAVDNSLIEGKTFEDGTPIQALPEDYYQLLSNTLTIPAGKVQGAVKVQLTDKFFADAKATSLNYVLPLRIVSAKDSVLEGKDYILYGLKYINKYTGAWISHGTDEIDLNGAKSTEKREAEYLEQNEIRYLTTEGLFVCNYTVSTNVEVLRPKEVEENGVKKIVYEKTIETLPCVLKLTFDDADNCVAEVISDKCSGAGSGKWTWKSAKNAWGGKDRDEIALNYTIDYEYMDYVNENGEWKTVQRHKIVKSADTLVMRDRQTKLETFVVK